jgi:branched-chain amino acid transport system substrate-binding protein
LGERTNRRGFLKVAGAGVGGLIVGGVLGSTLMTQPTAYTVTTTSIIRQTETVTATITPTLKPSESVRIGVGAFMSGPFVSEGEHIVNAAKMAVEEVQEAGWFMGGNKKIELYFADLGSVTPDEVKRAFEQLIEVYKTHINVVYWGSYGPGWDLTLKSGVPLITGDTPLGVTDFISKNPQIRLVDTYSALGTRRYQKTFLNFFDWLAKEGIWRPRNNTMYIVHSDFVWDADWARVMRSEAEEKGWKIVGFDLVPMNTVDWSPVLSKIRAMNPDIIVHADLIPADAATFASQFSTNPTRSLLINTWGFAPPESIKVADPSSLIGVVWGSGTMPIFKSRLYQDFSRKYEQKFGKEPYIAATHIYDSIYIALKALHFANTTEPEKVYNALFEIVHSGVEGRWAFDPATKIHYDYPEFAPNQLLQIQKVGEKITQYATIYPPQTAAFEFRLPSWLK